MTLARLNLICAFISLVGAVLLAFALQPPSVLVWLVASLVWFVLAIYKRKRASTVERPIRLIMRRFSRLFLFS